MEWKRVKSALIILFLIVDVFLAYKVYQKNIVFKYFLEKNKSYSDLNSNDFS